VVVTSINPLRIYVYEEGLARFATQKYSSHVDQKCNRFIHLTNYSVNKTSSNFKKGSGDTSEEEASSKWSLHTLKQKLDRVGIDSTKLFRKIDDIIVKTIISCESLFNNAVEMFVPAKENCFELFGFDILIDSALKPWLIEVNLSPSLNCDTQLD